MVYEPRYYPGVVGIYNAPDRSYTDLMFSHKDITVIDSAGNELVCNRMNFYLDGSYSLWPKDSNYRMIVVAESASFVDNQDRIHIDYEFMRL